MMEQGIIYYADPMLMGQRTEMNRPINLVCLTSVRDVGGEDCNGKIIETENGERRYMEGALERLIRETYPLRGALAGLFQVVGVITDDMPGDLSYCTYGALEGEDLDWIHPKGLLNADGTPIRDMTFNIPSQFRSLPRNARQERREQKYAFESRVFDLFSMLGGDVLISDHHMTRLDYLWGKFGLYGGLLNIHPAVTVKPFPYRFLGKTPTADAITSAEKDPMTRTGATLHVINKDLDKGPAIAYAGNTPVFAKDEPQWLRYRNYKASKLPVLIAGLAHYARNIYPFLGSIDLEQMQPVNGEGLDL